MATFNKFDDLKKSFADAVDASKIIIPDEKIRIVESEPISAVVENVMDDPFDSHTEKEKVDMLLRYNDIIRSDSDKIILASNMYSDWRIDKLYMNSFGISVEHRITDGIVYATARSRKGDDVQQYTSGWSNRQKFSVLNSLDDKVKKVKDIMTKKVVYFSPDDSIFDVAKVLAELDISGGPVVENKKVVGVITLSDILRYISVKTSVKPKMINPSISELILRLLELGKNQLEFKKEIEKIKSFKVRDVMTKNVITIHPDADIIEAASLLVKHGINRLPVVDRKGRLRGIVARADLIKAIVSD